VETAAPRKGFDLVAYLKLFRFPLVFTAIADSAAGYLLCAGGHEISARTLACLAVASSGLYFFGMALNDLADRARDREIAPTRVLPSGRLSVASATVAALLVLACSLGATLAVTGTPILQRAATWGAVVLFIAAYNLFLKVPPVMGLVRASNLLLGVAAVRRIEFDIAGQPWQYALMALPALVYVTALTYVSTLEDVGPARVKLTVGAFFMGAGAALAAIAGPAVQTLVYFVPAGEAFKEWAARSWSIGFSLGLILHVVQRAFRATDRKGVMLLVRDGVGGIILLDAALLASFGDKIPAFLLTLLVIPAAASVALFKRLA
jgi:4-hydroxybenzoate polyprenyltransferase